MGDTVLCNRYQSERRVKNDSDESGVFVKQICSGLSGS